MHVASGGREKTGASPTNVIEDQQKGHDFKMAASD